MVVIGEHWLFFGDGNVAKYQKKALKTRENGEQWYRFIILPSPDIVGQYNLKEDDPYFSSHGVTMKEYHHSQVVPMLDQAGFSKILILTGFDGSDTPASRHHLTLTEHLKNDEQMIKDLRVANVRLNQEFRKMANSGVEHLKDTVGLVNEARKGAPQNIPPMMDDGYGEQQQL